jgi:NAD+ diphosphatase
MIQDIHPHRFSNLYLANRTPQDDDYIFHYQGNTILLKTKGEELTLPQKRDFQELGELAEWVFLFTLDEVPCFLIWNELKYDNPQLAFTEIGFFRTTAQREIGWVTLVGLHLRNWYKQNRFCGSCGGRTQHKADERAMVCADCDTTIYPKISPAIIVAIRSNDKILLANNANFAPNWYSLVAGYTDVGETLEETVHREVKEEVGLDVWNIRYYGSQPWELSGSMMIGFIAEADENQPIEIDEKEITHAAWFERGNLPNRPNNISIAGEMIEKFERGEL